MEYSQIVQDNKSLRPYQIEAKKKDLKCLG